MVKKIGLFLALAVFTGIVNERLSAEEEEEAAAIGMKFYNLYKELMKRDTTGDSGGAIPDSDKESLEVEYRLTDQRKGSPAKPKEKIIIEYVLRDDPADAKTTEKTERIKDYYRRQAEKTCLCEKCRGRFYGYYR